MLVELLITYLLFIFRVRSVCI